MLHARGAPSPRGVRASPAVQAMMPATALHLSVVHSRERHREARSLESLQDVNVLGADRDHVLERREGH